MRGDAAAIVAVAAALERRLAFQVIEQHLPAALAGLRIEDHPLQAFAVLACPAALMVAL